MRTEMVTEENLKECNDNNNINKDNNSGNIYNNKINNNNIKLEQILN